MPQSAPGSVIELLGPSTGGIRMHVGELARRLAARGWTVATAGPAGVMAGAGSQESVVDVPSSWNPVALVRARRQLLAVGARVAPDVVHAHGLKAGLVALAARRSHHPPVIVTVHNLVSGTHSGAAARLLGLVERAILRRADQVIVISDEIEQRLDAVVPRSRRTFALPVSPARHVGRDRAEVRAEHGIADDAPLVVVVARHHRQKDLGMFLRAFAQVLASLPAARAVLVGDGPDRAAVEEERARLGLGEAVVVAGHRPNPADEMNAADVVALSSRWEGSPVAVAECLALGKPLVTTDVGTVARHLTDGVSARVVAVGDDRAFARALVEVLSDPQVAQTLGDAGHRVAEDVFDPDRLVDPIEDLYRRVMTGSRA